MRVHYLVLAVILLWAGCSVPELEERELKIVMGEASKETNSTSLLRLPGADPKPSLFREYDAKMVRRIQRRWFELTPLVQMRGIGQVVVDFRLTPDGQVTDVHERPTRLLGFSVDICKQAIVDSAPFDPWPAEMRRLIGEKGRYVTFTFNYTSGRPPGEAQPPPGTQIQTNGVKQIEQKE